MQRSLQFSALEEGIVFLLQIKSLVLKDADKT